jgi:hypothetical protein
MSGEVFIVLQGLLAFGAPLTLAFIELYKLRRRRPAPVGGGDPQVVVLATRRGRPEMAPSLPANADAVTRLAA